MQRLSSKAKAKFGVIVGAVALVTNSANAAVDVSGITLDVTSVETLAGAMLGALALIWVARKIIGFLR